MDSVLRWVETATAMRKITKTIVEYKQGMASFSISETTDFDIQGHAYPLSKRASIMGSWCYI